MISASEGGAMGKINIGRVILGGIVAGIIGNILGYLVDGLMLAPQWAAAMKTLAWISMTRIHLRSDGLLCRARVGL
jgi:hypothetical protein